MPRSWSGSGNRLNRHLPDAMRRLQQSLEDSQQNSRRRPEGRVRPTRSRNEGSITGRWEVSQRTIEEMSRGFRERIRPEPLSVTVEQIQELRREVENESGVQDAYTYAAALTGGRTVRTRRIQFQHIRFTRPGNVIGNYGGEEVHEMRVHDLSIPMGWIVADEHFDSRGDTSTVPVMPDPHRFAEERAAQEYTVWLNYSTDTRGQAPWVELERRLRQNPFYLKPREEEAPLLEYVEEPDMPMEEHERSIKLTDGVREIIVRSILYNTFNDLMQVFEENIIQLGWKLYHEQTNSEELALFREKEDILSRFITTTDAFSIQNMSGMPFAGKLPDGSYHIATNKTSWEFPLELPILLRPSRYSRHVLDVPDVESPNREFYNAVTRDITVIQERFRKLRGELERALGQFNTSKQFIEGNPDFARLAKHALKEHYEKRNPDLVRVFSTVTTREGFSSLPEATLAQVLPDASLLLHQLQQPTESGGQTQQPS